MHVGILKKIHEEYIGNTLCKDVEETASNGPTHRTDFRCLQLG